MILRVARHTDNLELLVKFYTEVIGLQIIGDFKTTKAMMASFWEKKIPIGIWNLLPQTKK